MRPGYPAGSRGVALSLSCGCPYCARGQIKARKRRDAYEGGDGRPYPDILAEVRLLAGRIPHTPDGRTARDMIERAGRSRAELVVSRVYEIGGQEAAADLLCLLDDLDTAVAGRLLTEAIPTSTITKVNKVLGRWFVTKYGTKQGILVIGRLAPFGIGAGIGGAGNALLGRTVVAGARRAFGPPGEWKNAGCDEQEQGPEPSPSYEADDQPAGDAGREPTC